jgi:molybdopterin-containing oxidoreductase family membrane subunit
VLQVMAVPVMPFDTWALYYPSWQEVATTILPVAYGIILVSLSYRYLPVFPNEVELNAAPEPVSAPEADPDMPAEAAPAQA